MASNYSILVDVDLDLEKIQSKLNSKKYKIDIDTNGVQSGAQDMRNASQAARELNDNGADLSLTYQVANDVFRRSIQVISSMVTQVRELDSAVTEFKKVSDLSGQQLDDYIGKLSNAGQTVARTGKPNRYEPVCCDGKAA